MGTQAVVGGAKRKEKKKGVGFLMGWRERGRVCGSRFWLISTSLPPLFLCVADTERNYALIICRTIKAGVGLLLLST